MIDTHAHIYLPAFKKDLDHVLDKASSAGVTDICMPAIDAQSLNQMKSVSHPAIRFHKMAGLHPCEVNHRLPDLRSMLEPLLNGEEFIAVGETGLDYYWSKDHIKEQKESFEVQLEMAKAFQKPIVIHNRNSTEDMLALVEKHQDGRLSGVWHCFNGTLEQGKKALELGLSLGIGGVLTYKNAGVGEVVKQLPLESMVLETDAPYLAPVPKRGKRNEPSFMQYTSEALAKVFDRAGEEILEITTRNAVKLFRLDKL